MRVTSLSRCTCWAAVVMPGVAPTLQAFVRFSALMRLLLPTFGYPMTPTLMPVLMCLFRQ